MTKVSSLGGGVAHCTASPEGAYLSPTTTGEEGEGASGGVYLSPMTKVSSLGGGVASSLNPQMARWTITLQKWAEAQVSRQGSTHWWRRQAVAREQSSSTIHSP